MASASGMASAKVPAKALSNLRRAIIGRYGTTYGHIEEELTVAINNHAKVLDAMGPVPEEAKVEVEPEFTDDEIRPPVAEGL